MLLISSVDLVPLFAFAFLFPVVLGAAIGAAGFTVVIDRREDAITPHAFPRLHTYFGWTILDRFR